MNPYIYNEGSSECFFVLQSGKDQINRKTFESLWTEYFMSNDPTAKGSYLFGTLTFQ